MIKQNDLTPLYQYMYLKEIRLENAYIQLENNIGLRHADYVDHLDIILQKHEIEVTNQTFKDISRETEKNKGIAPIYETNHYKWRFFAFDLYAIKNYYYIKLRLIRAKALIIKLSYLSGSSGFCWPFTI